MPNALIWSYIAGVPIFCALVVTSPNYDGVVGLAFGFFVLHAFACWVMFFSVGSVLAVVENYAQAPLGWAISSPWVLGFPFLLFFAFDGQIGLSDSHDFGAQIGVLTLSSHVFAWGLLFLLRCIEESGGTAEEPKNISPTQKAATDVPGVGSYEALIAVPGCGPKTAQRIYRSLKRQ
tara:strand:+ start:680 stop:1210 length:531 start_codon:yes stop_codon:yes gene_type:complete